MSVFQLILNILRRWSLDLIGRSENLRLPVSTLTADETLAKIEEALKLLRQDADKDRFQARYICEQLLWCKERLEGNFVPPWSPTLNMGLAATREYDMWGNEPHIAGLVSEIEVACNQLIPELKR